MLKTYNRTNLILNLWRKKSQRKNYPSESLLTKKSEGTLFSRLHIPFSSASFSRKIKNQKGRFTKKWFSFFLIRMSGNKDWHRSLSLEWYVILPIGKNLGLDCLTAWCSWQIDFSYFSFSRFRSFFSFSTLCDSPSVSQILLVFHWECGVWVCVFINQIDMKTLKRLVKNIKKRLSNGAPCVFFLKIKLYTWQHFKWPFIRNMAAPP